MRKNIFKFLPSYVGSKASWIAYLENYKNKKFVEVFCGSAVLSANLASSAILNDLDPKVYAILDDFDKQIVPEIFTRADYFHCRGLENWHEHAYCLQKMSFSGVFRYSKNGYNVPAKSNLEFVRVQSDYDKAKSRYLSLNPTVLNRQYFECNEFIDKECVLVFDPPYEKGQADYNVKNFFDFEFYWQYVRLNENICKNIVLFDYADNLPFKPHGVRKMRVNGALKGNAEGIFIFENSLKEGQKGEDCFYKVFADKLERLDGINSDFRLIASGKTVELKSDYYDNRRTGNFFFERYSNLDELSDGGPWQALAKGSHLFVYWFPKTGKMYVFHTAKLVDKLNNLLKDKKYDLIAIPNKSWTTAGYKIPRSLLNDVLLQEKDIY